MKPIAPLERLAPEPHRFSFDAAIRMLLHAARTADPGSVVRFRSAAGLAYPSADVLGLVLKDDGIPPDLVISIMGLTGPSGVLPRGYTEIVNATLRNRSDSLRDFLDLLSHRLVALFASAGTKYRPHRIAEAGLLSSPEASGGDPLSDVLLSLTGYGTPHLADRLPAGPEPLLHYAGLLTTQPRSAERLGALVSDWLGQPVEIRQFVGAWLPLPPDQQTRLPGNGIAGQFNRLGYGPDASPGQPAEEPAREDAAIGVRAWDPQVGVVLRIGPLDRASFTALLPGGRILPRLVGLVRAYLGLTIGFAINPIVAAGQVPALQLRTDADPTPRLGWNTWLTAPPGTRTHDAEEARFDAEVVEALADAPPSTAA